MSFTLAFDATSANFSRLPGGSQVAGYDSGTPDIRWSAAQFAAHPGALHIDQDASGSITTSDILDVERGAATLGHIVSWVLEARAAWNGIRRPGQRHPAIYASASNITPVVNTLVSGGVQSGVGLWVANWDLSEVQAIADVMNASGPFPVIGVQFASSDALGYDTDIFSEQWLDDVSGAAWVFTPVRSLTAKFGKSSIQVSGYSPTPPKPLGVGSYEMTVYPEGTGGPVLATYPRFFPKGSSSHFSFQGGSVPPGNWTVGVRAVATDGGHAGPWALASGTVTG
ncbi:MAG TPA: hypothetical protein VHE33_10375 [Acidobacteriaceae bacterium]|nr:hypothetical protein [Acidobacteriaceae bacterium]